MLGDVPGRRLVAVLTALRLFATDTECPGPAYGAAVIAYLRANRLTRPGDARQRVVAWKQ